MGAQEEVDYDQSEHSKIKCALSLVLLLALPPPRPRAPGLRPHTARQTLRAVPELTSTSSASCAGSYPLSSRGIVASRPSRCSSGRRPSRSRSASSASSGALKLARQAPASLRRRVTLTLVHPRSSFPPLWPLVIGYLTWVFLIDQAPMRGGRPQAWLRKSRVWEWFAGYYPVRCAPLSPPRRREASPRKRARADQSSLVLLDAQPDQGTSSAPPLAPKHRRPRAIRRRRAGCPS